MPSREPHGWTLAGQDTSRLLLAEGDLICGRLLLRGAETVARALAVGARPEADSSFSIGNVATGPLFARMVLPRIGTDLVAVGPHRRHPAQLPGRAF